MKDAKDAVEKDYTEKGLLSLFKPYFLTKKETKALQKPQPADDNPIFTLTRKDNGTVIIEGTVAQIKDPIANIEKYWASK